MGTGFIFEIEGDDGWQEIKGLSSVYHPEPIARLVNADTGEVIEYLWTMPEYVTGRAACLLAHARAIRQPRRS